MTELLDFLYSSSVWMTIIICVILFLCVGFAFANPFKNKKANYAYKIFLYAFAFCFMMSFEFLYYGYTDEFETLSIGKTTICFFEQYERGGEGPSENVSRIHIIDKNTGKRKDRFYSGPYGNIVGMRNDTLCYLSKDDVVLFDAVNLTQIYKIKKEEWGSILSELSVGIESVSGNQKSSNMHNAYIELYCKNAKKYWFDPFAKKILEKEPSQYSLPAFAKKEYELTVIDGPGRQRNFLTDTYSNGKLKMILPGTYGKKFFSRSDSSTYIDPFFLCIDTLKKVFVFGHYFTTDREDFYLEAKDFDFKTKWKKKSAEFASDADNKPEVNVWEYLNGILYFNIGGFVIAIQPETSKIVWTTRL